MDKRNDINKKQDWRSNDSATSKSSTSQSRDTSSVSPEKRAGQKPSDTISSNASNRSADTLNKRDTSSRR